MRVKIVDNRPKPPGEPIPEVDVVLEAVPRRNDQVHVKGWPKHLSAQFIIWEIDPEIPSTHYAGHPTVYLR